MDLIPTVIQVTEDLPSIIIAASGYEPSPIVITVGDGDIAPVRSVNDKIGFVHLDKTDIGLNLVENISILQVSGALYDQITFGDRAFSFITPLISGEDVQFISYPSGDISSLPTSVECILQNNIDDIIYGVHLGKVSLSGFYVNFTDVLYSDLYLLKSEIKM